MVEPKKPDRKQIAVTHAMETLFTRKQIQFIQYNTMCGYSKMRVIRKLINAGMYLESEIRQSLFQPHINWRSNSNVARKPVRGK